MTPTPSLLVAEIAYDSYAMYLIKHKGMTPRAWIDLPAHQQEAWEAGISAVLMYRQRLPKQEVDVDHTT